MKKLLLLLICLPQLALAGGGAWHASAPGPGLINRGMQAPSPALKAATPVNGAITEINWRYTLNGPTPSGFAAWLCAETRCVRLEGGSGSTRGLTNIQAGGSLHFVYGVQGKGRLPQALRVLGNEVMVNYR
ncbi:flagellar protein FlhE [Erwinia sp. BNK-24-b]|uniref:flagellar protein FlhE n=1 Tax=Erwinia TaxID=551 RepID=UPI001FF01284|nr:flagellar protein FlhE [Erwinia phyllosphaerae]MBV4365146.1 flagellar protein FlhE [Erwinia phyllosphaerae]